MQRLYRKQHIVTSVVAVILDDRDRVLLTRRSVPPFLGLWVMPGGKIGLGEPMLSALHREVREEVGIDVTVGALVDVFEHVTPGDENDHHVILYHRCRPSRLELSPNPAEVAEARWVSRDELPRYPLPEGARHVLSLVFPELGRPETLAPPDARPRVRILDAPVGLAYPLGHHLHCLVGQIPTRLETAERGYAIADPAGQWALVRSVLDVAATGEHGLGKVHFLVLPESAVPAGRLDDVLAAVAGRFRESSVTMLGLEHVRLRAYRELLRRFRGDNGEALELVERDVRDGAPEDLPVNACAIVVKEPGGRLRVLLEAKSHPFRGEEFLDRWSDLYRGRHFYLLRSSPACFNFMVLVCLDYLYRDLYASNIRQVIDRANQLFFTTRQTLDALFVLQCDPKPEHPAYRDVLAGFYGEYLEDTPGVRETVTVFGNCSGESAIDREPSEGRFGASSVVFGRRHKLARVQGAEFSTDDFGGAPLCRLRFGRATRLYYFNLPLAHEPDPRSSRAPLKVHQILARAAGGGWEPVAGGGTGHDLALGERGP